MTALLTPSQSDLAPADAPLRGAEVLAGLAQAAAGAPDTTESRRVLGDVVSWLERAAGADLGPTGGDPLVVLQRRLGRVHGLLLRGGPPVDAEDIRAGTARLYRAS